MSIKSWVRMKNWIKSFCVGDGLVQNSQAKEFDDEWLEGDWDIYPQGRKREWIVVGNDLED